jgi:hypothetical protein
MQKVIIDTNVIVSSLIQKSYPYYIIFDLLRDLSAIKYRELEYRKTAGRLLKMAEKMREQLLSMRPL